MRSLQGSWGAQEKGRLVVLLARPRTATGLYKRRKAYKVVPQQIQNWYYSSKALLWLCPILRRYSSSSATFDGVALWREGDGCGGYVGEEFALEQSVKL